MAQGDWQFDVTRGYPSKFCFLQKGPSDKFVGKIQVLDFNPFADEDNAYLWIGVDTQNTLRKLTLELADEGINTSDSQPRSDIVLKPDFGLTIPIPRKSRSPSGVLSLISAIHHFEPLPAKVLDQISEKFFNISFSNLLHSIIASKLAPLPQADSKVVSPFQDRNTLLKTVDVILDFNCQTLFPYVAIQCLDRSLKSDALYYADYVLDKARLKGLNIEPEISQTLNKLIGQLIYETKELPRTEVSHNSDSHSHSLTDSDEDSESDSEDELDSEDESESESKSDPDIPHEQLVLETALKYLLHADDNDQEVQKLRKEIFLKLVGPDFDPDFLPNINLSEETLLRLPRFLKELSDMAQKRIDDLEKQLKERDKNQPNTFPGLDAFKEMKKKAGEDSKQLKGLLPDGTQKVKRRHSFSLTATPK